jgi:hypothetical protein
VSKETWYVFQEAESRSHLTNDPDCLWPEVAVVGLSFSLAGAGPGLAGETGSDNIHAAAQTPAVEGSDVVPDGERLEVPLFLASKQDLSAVRIDLNCCNCSPSKQD